MDKFEFTYGEALHKMSDYICRYDHIRGVMGDSPATQESVDEAFEELATWFYDNEIMTKKQLMKIYTIIKGD